MATHQTLMMDNEKVSETLLDANFILTLLTFKKQ
jgi:hypothetical protein